MSNHGDAWYVVDGVWTQVHERETATRYPAEGLTASVVSDLDAAIDEIIRLQERVRSLERAQRMPDNSFWGQLIFDIGMVVTIVLMLMLWR